MAGVMTRGAALPTLSYWVNARAARAAASSGDTRTLLTATDVLAAIERHAPFDRLCTAARATRLAVLDTAPPERK